MLIDDTPGSDFFADEEEDEGLSEVGPSLPEDRMWMARALEQARLAETLTEVPVGAVIVQEGALLSEGHNLTVTTHDPTSHAEVVAIREAARRLGDFRLTGSTLYVTLEPCAMCAGAIVLARIDRVVFGARDPKAGMVRTHERLLEDRRLNHRAEVTEGVLAAEASRLLTAFFRRLRR